MAGADKAMLKDQDNDNSRTKSKKGALGFRKGSEGDWATCQKVADKSFPSMHMPGPAPLFIYCMFYVMKKPTKVICTSKKFQLATPMLV